MRTLFCAGIGSILLAVGTQALRADEPTIVRIAPAPGEGRSLAVKVEGAALWHSSQIVPPAGENESIEEQIDAALNTLESLLRRAGATRSHVVKLDLYLLDQKDRAAVESRLRAWFGDEHLPAVAYVQSRLPRPGAKVALDAVFAAPQPDPLTSRIETSGSAESSLRVYARLLPRGDVVYVSGQAEPGDLPTATRATLASLAATLNHLELERRDIVALKCFLTPMDQTEVVDREIAAFFGEEPVPPVSHVEWISGSRPIEIELIAAAPRSETGATISYFTPPGMSASPVFSRVSRIHGDRRIYLSGLESRTPGDGAAQTHDVFDRIKALLDDAGSDLRHLAKATYYVSDDDASAQLNQIRPGVYDPARPPAASKAFVTGVGRGERGISIDLIAAPVATR